MTSTPCETARASCDAQLADEISGTLSFGVGRKNRVRRCADRPPALRGSRRGMRCPRSTARALQVKARQQLGTVGSGNHYVDVFADETGALWVGVHFGSRGFGHTVASAFLALARASSGASGCPRRKCCSPVDAPLGHDYWALMELAGDTHTPGASGWPARWYRCSAAASWSWCTTITTSPGRRRTTARSCRRAEGRHAGLSGPAAASSADRWETTR